VKCGGCMAATDSIQVRYTVKMKNELTRIKRDSCWMKSDYSGDLMVSVVHLILIHTVSTVGFI
jgi:hypothetical protein